MFFYLHFPYKQWITVQYCHNNGRSAPWSQTRPNEAQKKDSRHQSLQNKQTKSVRKGRGTPYRLLGCLQTRETAKTCPALTFVCVSKDIQTFDCPPLVSAIDITQTKREGTRLAMDIDFPQSVQSMVLFYYSQCCHGRLLLFIRFLLTGL